MISLLLLQGEPPFLSLNKDVVLFFGGAYIFPIKCDTISTDQTLVFPIQFLSLLVFFCLLVYFKAKLKDGDKNASPCFRPIYIENVLCVLKHALLSVFICIEFYGCMDLIENVVTF